jgi:5-methylcytosine-specific restriction endonuclease McrA
LSEAHQQRSRESYATLSVLNRSEKKRGAQSTTMRGHSVSVGTRSKIRAKTIGNSNAVNAPVKGECVYCLRPAQTFDHMIPRGQSGWDDPDNVVPACYSCNTMKWTRTPAEWLEDILAGRGTRDHRHPHE